MRQGLRYSQRSGVQRRRHYENLKVGAVGFLQIQGPGQRDVAVKVAFVKLVEDERGNAAQLRVLKHLPQQHAFGNETDARVGAGDVLEANLVADFAAKLGLAFPGDTRGQQTRRQPARLQDHDLPVPSTPRSSSIAEPGWISPNPSARTRSAAGSPGAQPQRLLDLVDWQSFRHEGATLAVRRA